MATPSEHPVDEELYRTREKDWERFTSFVTVSTGGCLIVLALLAIFLL